MFSRRPLRVALYSHDAMGVGHVRRNLLIAQSLNESLQASALLICGVHEAGLFPSGDGIDCLTLPALAKLPDGTYVSRELGIPVEDLIRVRAATLKAALLSYQPDILIVDKLPCGILNELREVVERLAAGGKTRLVLGLREVLDQPEVVRDEWRENDFDASIRKFYDALWVYGDPAVFDPRLEYQFAPDIARMVQFTGYFDQRERLRHATMDGPAFMQGLGIPDGRHVLCTVGGGQDGQQLAVAFAESEFPRDTHGLLVTGPFMPADVRTHLMRLRMQRPQLHVVDYVSDADALMPHMDAVVCMGGYNTIASVISFQKPALVAPRVYPRREQMIRARRFESLGLLSVLTPDNLSPHSVGEWLHRRPRPSSHDVDLGATRKLPDMVSTLLARPSRRRPHSSTAFAEAS